jgi:hypothetical protein
MVAVMGLTGISQVYAQDSVPGPGAVVVTIIPGGATFFTQSKNTKEPELLRSGAHFGKVCVAI